MEDSHVDTVILVCDDEGDSNDILNKLVAGGVGIVGHATTASMAMTLAAQTFANIAVLARRPTGALSSELARDLMKTWGVRSLVLEGNDETQEDWSPEPAQAARLRSLLSSSPA